MLFDPVYWFVLGIGLLLGFLATARMKAAVAHYSRIGTRSGFTGAQVARAILQANGIRDVQVETVQGQLTDHYDPTTKTLRLSESVYGERSVAAVGIAAHEVGHAIQHATGYGALKFRSAWVPVAGFGSNLGIWVIIAAAAMGGVAHAPLLSWLGLGLFATSTVFTLITLPVEFDASKRAMATLQHSGVLGGDELPGARTVLNAAAMTYVAGFVSSLLVLLYWAMRLGLFSGQRSEE